MQILKLGLEIRKIGSLHNLYEDVDRVLGNYNVPEKSISKSIQSATVAHSLQRMLKVENHFSVCAIRDGAKLCQIVIPEERMLVYSSIHCHNWNEKLPDFRQVVVAMVLDDFRTILNPQITSKI